MQLAMKVQWAPPILRLNGKVTIRVFEKMEQRYCMKKITIMQQDV